MELLATVVSQPVGKPRTRFADVSRRQAWAILVLTVAVLAWGLWSMPPMALYNSAVIVAPDEELYRKMIEDVGTGANYYDALARALGGGDSIFNWRLPTYACALSVLPDLAWVKATYIVLNIATMALAVKTLLADLGRFALIVCIVLFFGGTLAWATFDPIEMTTEPWAGLFIVLSLCAYARQRRILGAALGVMALFVRELAGVYCVPAVYLAWRDRRWRELGFWLVALAGFGVFFLWHMHEIHLRSAASEVTNVDRWVGFPNPMNFFLQCRINIFLRPFAPQFSVLYVCLSYLGLAGWHGPVGERLFLSALACAVVFGIMVANGHEYWGLMYAPLLTFGLVRAPAALSDLVKGMFGKTAVKSDSLRTVQ